MDGYRYDSSVISKLMWKYDRGRHPVIRERSWQLIESGLDIERKASVAVYHHYLILPGTPKR